MYSSIPEFNPDSTLCDSTAFTTCLRPVFYCLGRKKTYKGKKKARSKVDLLTRFFKWECIEFSKVSECKPYM